MSILKSLATATDIAPEKDSLGGARVLESNTYPMKVHLAYLQIAPSGAIGLVVHLKGETGTELQQTLWMCSGRDKGGKNYYEKDGQKTYLPGFLLANSLCQLTVGKEISELETEKKLVNVWSSEAKAQVPTNVEMLTDLLGKEIVAAVIKQIVDKTKKVEGTNTYAPTGETREENEVDKFFQADTHMTVAELKAQAPEASFYNAWREKWAGKVKERAKGIQGGQGTAGAPKGTTGLFGAAKAASGSSAGATKPASLFGN